MTQDTNVLMILLFLLPVFGLGVVFVVCPFKLVGYTQVELCRVEEENKSHHWRIVAVEQAIT